MESYSVEAILSATDSGFTSAMNNANKSLNGVSENAQKSTTSIMDIAKGVGVFKLVDIGVNAVKDSVGGAIERFDTLKRYPNVMKQLGYSADEVDTSMTKMKDGIDGLPTSLDEIVTNAQSLSMITGSLDKGTDSAIAMNNAFLASGASTADASRGLTQYSQMLGKGKVDMQAWSTMVDTMGLSLEQVANSFGYAGSSAKTDLYDALQSGKITMTEFNDKMIEMYGTGTKGADLAKANSKGVATSIKNLYTAIKTGIEGMMSEFNRLIGGSDDFNAIAANIDKVKPVIGTFFNILKGAIAPAITLIKALFTVLKPLTPILVAVAGAFVAVKTQLIALQIIATITKMVKGLGMAFTILQNLKFAGTIKMLMGFMGPGGWIIAAIGAVIAAITWLWTTNETFRNVVMTIWNGLKVFFAGLGKWFANFWDSMKEAPGKVSDFIQKKWEATKQFFSDMWNGLVESATSAWNNVMAVISPIITTITTIFQPLIDFFGILWENIMTIAVSWWEIIKSVIMAPILFLIDLITGNFTQLKDDISLIWTTISTNAVAIWNSLVNIIVGYVSAVVSTVVNIFNTLKDGVINIWNTIVNTGRSLWQSFTSWLSGLVTGAKDAVINGWNALKQGTIDIFNGIVNTAVSIWDGFKQKVSDIIDGVVHIFDVLKDIDLLEIGKAIIDGFVKGLKSAWDAGMDFIGGIGDWIRDHKGPITYDRKLLIPAGNAIIDGLNKGLEQKFKAVKSTVSGMTDYFANTSLGTTLAVDTNYGNLQSSLSSANMSLSSNNELTLNESKKPANIQLNLGGTNYTGFVSDISSEMAIQVDLNRQN